MPSHIHLKPFPLNMPAAMHLAVLLLLFAVTVCGDSTASSTTKPEPQSTAGPTALTTSTVGKTTNVALSTTTTSSKQVTTNTLTSSTPSTSTQTPSGAEVTTTRRQTEMPTTNQTSTGIPAANQTSTGIPPTNQTSTGVPPTNQTSTRIPITNQTSTGIPVTNQTVTNGSTIPPTSGTPYFTANTTVNATGSALSPDMLNGLASNPGLVAIIFIFCIVIILALVVAAVKCSPSSRNNFERLEDVPMGKVNEGSPFAHYSK
ncbi:protein CIST1-like [Limanda limanda]|uniref:protein CIST1-like n=1 Tax=Limanda limanda TaxID=27771 RepID=UPI0029C766A9|nr:protein CIST1-like [Limanda limanda]